MPHTHHNHMSEVLSQDRVKKVAKLVFGSLGSEAIEQLKIKRTT